MREKTLLERVEEASRQPVNEIEPLPCSPLQACDPKGEDKTRSATNSHHREDFNFLLNAASRAN